MENRRRDAIRVMGIRKAFVVVALGQLIGMIRNKVAVIIVVLVGVVPYF